MEKEKYALAILGIVVVIAVAGLITPNITSYGVFYKGNFINAEGALTRTVPVANPNLNEKIIIADGPGYVGKTGFWRCSSDDGSTVVVNGPGSVDLFGRIECTRASR